MSEDPIGREAEDTPENESEELYEHHRFVVDPKQSPIRLDLFLLDRLERASRNRIQQSIHGGYVRVDGRNIKPNHKVRPAEVITIMWPRPPRDGNWIKPEPIPLDIRYEDDDILIVHKPAGMAVHPGIGRRSGTLVNALVHYLQNTELPIKKGNLPDRPGLVHRIDKNTTGLMVLAKNDQAMTHLGRQFFNHTVKRKYVALVWGEPEEEEGVITGHIGRHPRHRLQFHVFPEGETGKHAVTHFRVLERLYYVSLLECWLETGRTHQIRVHMKYLGHPLFNDERYDGNRIVKGTVFNKYKRFVENCFTLLPRQALHAKSLGFVHPVSGEELYFDSELPPDFQAVLDKWRVYLAGRKQSQD